jgi:DNA repair protein RecO (recombination protein O)
MAHHIYHTDAFVLSSRPLGDSSKNLVLLTRRFGRISAVARGIRKEKSKLRYSLEYLRFARVSIIRGRDRWRLVGAVLNENLPNRIGASSILVTTAQVAQVLERMLHDEEPNEVVFDEVVSFFSHAYSGKFEGQELGDIEKIVMLRLLGRLGYLEDVQELRTFVDDSWRADSLEGFGQYRKKAVSMINNAFFASQM